MPKIAYSRPSWMDRFAKARKKNADADVEDHIPERSKTKVYLIQAAMKILDEYDKQGYQLTLRQLYYQFVARDMLPNSQKSYNLLGDAVSDGRMWGLIDWDHLVDRGRNFISRPNWPGPAEILASAAQSYHLDLWEESEYRVEVWVEKQALEDIVAQACHPLDVGYLACKGYMSQSEMWAAAQRLIDYEAAGQKTVVIHLGDHDPSGIDMTRDLQDRFHGFNSNTEVRRIALNMDQVEHYSPPPNPAKITDSRADSYIFNYGEESWELDALEPAVLVKLIRDTIEEYRDDNWFERERLAAGGRELLGQISDNWDDICDFLEKRDG